MLSYDTVCMRNMNDGCCMYDGGYCMYDDGYCVDDFFDLLWLRGFTEDRPYIVVVRCFF